MALKAILKQLDPPGAEAEEINLHFQPDDTKKSVFWLEESSSGLHSLKTTDVGALCIISHENEEEVFIAGGVQIVSNSKMIEVFLQSTTLEGAPTYLTTARGIPSKEQEGLFKVLCVFPGGPRPIYAIRLNMKSLKPSPATCLSLSSLRLTARLTTETNKPSSSNTTTRNKEQETIVLSPVVDSSPRGPLGMRNPLLPPPTGQPIPTSSSNDVLSAVAGLSLMVRSSEERLTKTVVSSNESTNRIMTENHASLMRLVETQSALIAKQTAAIANLTDQVQAQSRELIDLREKVDAAVSLGGNDTLSFRKPNKSTRTDETKEEQQVSMSPDTPQLVDDEDGESLLDTKDTLRSEEVNDDTEIDKVLHKDDGLTDKNME